MTEARLTRRQLLAGAAALGALPAVYSLGCGEEPPPDPGPLARALAALPRDRESAAAVGRAWLEKQGAPPDAAEIARRLAGDAEAEDREALRRRLAARHRSDFEQHRLLPVGGWLLTETELSLYALAALVGQESDAEALAALDRVVARTRQP